MLAILEPGLQESGSFAIASLIWVRSPECRNVRQAVRARVAAHGVCVASFNPFASASCLQDQIEGEWHTDRKGQMDNMMLILLQREVDQFLPQDS